MRLANHSIPLEGSRQQFALLGLVQTTSFTGGFDYNVVKPNGGVLMVKGFSSLLLALVALALAGFLLLTVWKSPPWIVVVLLAVAGLVFGGVLR